MQRKQHIIRPDQIVFAVMTLPVLLLDDWGTVEEEL